MESIPSLVGSISVIFIDKGTYVELSINDAQRLKSWLIRVEIWRQITKKAIESMDKED